jgi:hypothetical protein
MKSNYRIEKIFLACIALITILFVNSCTEDDENSGEVVLLSFGPTGAQHGEQIKLIGQNLNQVTAIDFAGAEVPASAFTSQTPQLIEVLVPNSAEAGKIILKTPQGDIESKTVLSFKVVATINSITAEAKPGTPITISGDKLNWIESVTFSDDLVVEKEEFVSQSISELVVNVPMEAKTGFLEFTSGGTKPLAFESENPLTVTLPEVSSLSPSAVKHTENLTISGTDLDLVTKVTFPGSASVLSSAFASQTETQIVLAVPATSTNGKLVLTVPSGLTVETTSSITIILPIVTAFSPSDPASHIAGNTLTLTGTDLDLVGQIKFPGVTAAVTDFQKTSTEIVVVIPDGVIGGTVVLNTIHGFTVPVTVPFGNQLTLTAVIFDDALKSTFTKGGWGSPDIANTENPRVGSVSIKSTFTGGYSGGGQFGTWSGTPLPTSGTTYFAFSVFGDAGTDGKSLIINFNGGPQAFVTIVEGQWKDVKIALSSVGSPATISEISFQDTNWSGVVYIDQVGLK